MLAVWEKEVCPDYASLWLMEFQKWAEGIEVKELPCTDNGRAGAADCFPALGCSIRKQTGTRIRIGPRRAGLWRPLDAHRNGTHHLGRTIGESGRRAEKGKEVGGTRRRPSRRLRNAMTGSPFLPAAGEVPSPADAVLSRADCASHFD
jgi:hypothetical protein